MNDHPPDTPSSTLSHASGTLFRIRRNSGKEEELPANYANLREKEIGSWFSLAFADKNNCRFLD
jgi:hypothetical protein